MSYVSSFAHDKSSREANVLVQGCIAGERWNLDLIPKPELGGIPPHEAPGESAVETGVPGEGRAKWW